ncbi:MAG: hypothetical protein WCL44_13095, partial [bacterium]
MRRMCLSTKSGGAGRLPVVVGLFLALLVWAVFTWPLPRHITEGIPASASASCGSRARSMISGDHLQLQYRFWLFHDMLRGESPWLSNIYEFNTGPDDKAVIKPGSWYFPFSLVYAAFAQAGGRALAWNLTGLLSLLMTFVFTRSLVRRYVQSEWIAIPAALLAIAIPYRYEALLGGSPAGFAMMWVPMLFLGIDVAVRDGRVAGGVIAGVALFFAAMTDTQVFFFSALASPAWGLVALVNAPWTASNSCEAGRVNFRKLVLALLPFVIISGAAVLLAFSSKAELIKTAQSAARSVQEARDCAPDLADFFAVVRRSAGAQQVYLGWVPIVLVVAGLGVGGMRVIAGRKMPVAAFATLVLLTLGTVLVVAMALGPEGPMDGLLFRVCRRVIPKYSMVRQTAKVLCVLPVILAVAVALAWTMLVPAAGRWGRAVPALAAVVMLVEYSSHIKAEICLLAREQPAYSAMADDAAVAGRTVRAMAIPLWPGDSHWSSLYEYYSSLYRIRMVNGYRPVVNAGYYRDVFEEYRSFNSGKISDQQLDRLLTNGVTHLVLHEDAFPEKVSPFPVGLTLKQLLNHPRLVTLVDSGGVWAFRILREPAPKKAVCSKWDVFFPARYFEAERCS